MSNVLKKITKKYKWLRFLNYKTTKLTVLSVALFGLCLSSGASFAKYRDENYGGGNAGAAKFEYGNIFYTPYTEEQPQSKELLSQGVYVFVREFQLEIPVVEVSISYTVKLRMLAPNINDFDVDKNDTGISRTSFTTNQTKDEFYYFGEENNTLKTLSNTLSYIATGAENKITHTPGYWHYAVSDDKTNYEWKSSNVIDDKGIISIDSGVVNAGKSLIKYFKIVIFVTAIEEYNNTTKEEEWKAEDSKIFFSLTAIQEENV